MSNQMTHASVWDAIAKDPINVKVICRGCDKTFTGAGDIIDHLDAHD